MRVFWDILSRVMLALMMALVGYLFTQQLWVSAVILALNLILHLCVDRRMNRAVHARLHLQKRYPLKYLPDVVVTLGNAYNVAFPGRKTRDLLLECIPMEVYTTMRKKHGGPAEDFYARVTAGKFTPEVLTVTDKHSEPGKNGSEICTIICGQLAFPVEKRHFDSICPGDFLVGFCVDGFPGPVQVYLPDMVSTWHTLIWKKSMEKEFRRK